MPSKKSRPPWSSPLDEVEPDPEPEVIQDLEPDPEPEPEPSPGPKPNPPMVDLRVTEFLWNGTIRYRCSKCPFDAGTKLEALNHFSRNHALIQAPQVQQIDTGLVTPAGEKIVRLEEAQNGENSTDGS